jgi:hypothetical protein
LMEQKPMFFSFVRFSFLSSLSFYTFSPPIDY